MSTAAQSVHGDNWRAIEEWGAYQVSDGGQVRSLDRRAVNRAGQTRFYRGRILKPCPNRGGYLLVDLCEPGRRQTVPVHLLVLTTFKGSRPIGQEARHLDGNKLNNTVSNLVWGTHSQNIFDKIEHGTHYPSAITHCTLGHPLQAPNVVAALERKGWRGCLACQRARSAVKNALRWGKPVPDLKTEADARFAQIVDGHSTRYVDIDVTRRRIQGLAVLGWRNEDIAVAAGIPLRQVSYLVKRSKVSESARDAIRVAFDALGDRPGPSPRTRALSLAKGWALFQDAS